METNTNQQAQVAVAPVVAQESAVMNDAFSSAERFDLIQRIGKTFGQSALVPEAYKMKNPQDVQAIANCIIAVDMAQRMHANPLMVMQNLYIVHGNPGWSSKFLIACLNGCGRFSPIRYEFKGKENTDSWSCRAYAIDKATGEQLAGAWVSIELAKKEGWFGKSGSKWQSMPELMLQYRAAAFFQRVYAPEISMGFATAEEAEDIYGAAAPSESAAPAPVVEEAEAQVVDAEQKVAAAKLFA